MYLRVVLDVDLSFKNHFNMRTKRQKKLSKAVGVLTKVKLFLKLEVFSLKLNCFLARYYCLGYIVQFFILVFNMEYYPILSL